MTLQRTNDLINALGNLVCAAPLGLDIQGLLNATNHGLLVQDPHDFFHGAPVLIRNYLGITEPEQSDHKFLIRISTDDVEKMGLAGNRAGGPFNADVLLPQDQTEILCRTTTCCIVLALEQSVIAFRACHHQPTGHCHPTPIFHIGGFIAFALQLVLCCIHISVVCVFPRAGKMSRVRFDDDSAPSAQRQWPT